MIASLVSPAYTLGMRWFVAGLADLPQRKQSRGGARWCGWLALGVAAIGVAHAQQAAAPAAPAGVSRTHKFWKAMSSLKSGKGMVLVLVNLQ